VSIVADDALAELFELVPAPLADTILLDASDTTEAQGTWIVLVALGVPVTTIDSFVEEAVVVAVTSVIFTADISVVRLLTASFSSSFSGPVTESSGGVVVIGFPPFRILFPSLLSMTGGETEISVDDEAEAFIMY
jgi:hypothetical protein